VTFGSRKKYLHLFLGALPVLLGLIPTPGGAVPEGVPAGFQEFIVLGREYQAWEFLNHTTTSEGDPSGVSAEFVSLIAITASTDGQVVFLDHWEDGYEETILVPSQSSTGEYELGRGDRLYLASDGSGGGINDFVPLNPRGTGLRYDGGDRIVSIGGPLNVLHGFWPRDQVETGNAWELYPREALSGSWYFRVPVASDRWDGPSGSYAPFKYTEVTIAAFQDGTRIALTDGSHSLSVSLDRGEHYYSRTGCINEACDPDRVFTVTTGTEILGDQPFLVGLLSAGGGLAANRFYHIQPAMMYGFDYVLPFEGGTRGFPDHGDSNLYIFNPNSTPVTIQVFNHDFPLPGLSFEIPAETAANYYEKTPAPQSYYLPDTGTTVLHADQMVLGLTAYNYQGSTRDWGNSLVPARRLARSYAVPWAPGSSDLSGSSSCLWASPLEDRTEVRIDLDGDGGYEQVDADGDGVPDAGDCPGDENCYLLDLLDVLRVYDPADHDNSGTFVFASGPVAMAYGQDKTGATGDPALDLGYEMLPGGPEFVDPVLSLTGSADAPHVSSSGGDRLITQKIQSHGFAPVSDLSLVMTVNAEVSFVPASGVITFPDGTVQYGVDPQFTEIVGGELRFGGDFGDVVLGLNEAVTMSYLLHFPESLENASYPLMITAEGRYASISLVPIFDGITIVKTPLALGISVDRDQASAGDVLAYEVCVENNGSGPGDAAGNLSIVSPVAEGLLVNWIGGGGYLDPVAKAVRWDLGDLEPGDPEICNSFRAAVKVLPETERIVKARAEGRSDTLGTVYSNPVNTRVHFPLLEVQQAAPPPDPVAPGEAITYEIHVSAGMSVPDGEPVVVNFIPPDTQFLQGSLRVNNGSGWQMLTDAEDGDGGEYDEGMNAVLFTISGMSPGDSIATSFQAEVQAGVPAGRLIANRAVVLYLPGQVSTVTNEVGAEVGTAVMDSDGDGIPDEVEGTGDPDGDGIPNYLDEDSDGDGIGDAAEGTGDPDGDGVANFLDDDSDGDGMPDFWESAFGLDPWADDGALDADGDELTNLSEFVLGTNPGNTDSDGDGIGDYLETVGGMPVDTDQDGVIDALDLDADGDGIPDTVEGTEDQDGDGIPCFRDSDSDGDGIGDAAEGTGDPDGDGVANFLDDDSDGDGMPDEWEHSSGFDPYVDDGMADPDGDGLGNLDEYSRGTDPYDQDTDGDGMPDGWEAEFGLDPLWDDGYGDQDGDGLFNLNEYVLGTIPLGVDTDRDGISDYEESDGGEAVDTDRDGIIDALDNDSDGDGKPDLLEGTGDIDGDGVPDYRDADDEDGLDGANDDDDSEGSGEAQDDEETTGEGGEGTEGWEGAIDQDGDGIPDYFDMTHTDESSDEGYLIMGGGGGMTCNTAGGGGGGDGSLLLFLVAVGIWGIRIRSPRWNRRGFERAGTSR